jgi:hypothetical protein
MLAVRIIQFTIIICPHRLVVTAIVSSTMAPVHVPCGCKKGYCKVCRECTNCKCACEGEKGPKKKRQRTITPAPTDVSPRASLTRSVKDSDEVVERRKIYIASLTEPDTVFAVENTLLPEIREIKTLKDVFDALQLKGTISSLPSLDSRERFTSEDAPKVPRLTAMTKLLGEAIEKIAGFFAPNGAQALIRCTLHSTLALIKKSPMESLIEVFAQTVPHSLESRVARAIIVNSTPNTTRYLATLDGKHKITVGRKNRDSGAKDFAALAVGEPIPTKKMSVGHSQSENVRLEKEIAAYKKQVVALKTELESVKTSLTSTEKRASAAEEELLATKETLKNKEESETRLEGELSAAKQKEIEARLEEDLYEAV